MTTPGLPNLPSRKTTARKIARYKAIADAHRAGEHDSNPDPRKCKYCREAAA